MAVLHSHLTTPSGTGIGSGSPTGEVQVVVGARSAIFAPTPHLGLIVLDEEHESSFKQDTAPRYHARDVAAQRALAEKVPLVLGSATPSLESWHAAQRGEYRLVEMPRRVLDRPLPDVATIDLRDAAVRDAQSRGRSAGSCIRRCSEALRRRRAGDSAAEPPRLLDAHSMSGLRPRGAVSRIATSR